MTPTRRSKRKSGINPSSSLASSQHKHVKTLAVLKPRGLQCLSPVVLSSTDLLSCCIHSMIKYNWYRVVPINDWKCDDIAFSMGQSWDLLRLLMIELGHIKVIMGVDCVRVEKLLLLCETIEGEDSLIFHTPN